jgi:hypothetical protein
MQRRFSRPHLFKVAAAIVAAGEGGLPAARMMLVDSEAQSLVAVFFRRAGSPGSTAGRMPAATNCCV